MALSDPGSEYGRLLAERDRLIAAGADPAELELPLAPLGPTFDRIYRRNLWAGDESRSGPGSGRAATARLVTTLRFLVTALGIQSVTDAACGDGAWWPDLPVGYVGLDVSPAAIELARRRHPDRRYAVHDLRDGLAGHADLIVVRDALQHLPLEDGMRALKAAQSAGYWLLASTFVGGDNVDVRPGEAYSPDLEALPFSLGRPALLIPDGFAYDDPDRIRDGRKMLGLWDIA